MKIVNKFINKYFVNILLLHIISLKAKICYDQMHRYLGRILNLFKLEYNMGNIFNYQLAQPFRISLYKLMD